MTPARRGTPRRDPATAKAKPARAAKGSGRPRKAAPTPSRRVAAIDGDAMLGAAERIVAQALRRGCDQAESYMEAGVGLDVEVENGAVATTSTWGDQGGSVRIVKDGRIGFAYFVRSADAPSAIDKALALARIAPRKGFALPAGGKPRSLARRWDGEVAALDPEASVAAAGVLVSSALAAAPQATVSGGGVSLEAGAYAVANSEGVAAWDRMTLSAASASLTLKDGETAISASDGESGHGVVPAERVGTKAGELVMSLRGPKPAERKGRMPVLFKPEAAAELVAGLMVGFALGDDARRGKTPWSKSLGKQVAATHLSLHDDPFVTGAVGGTTIDAEGLPTARLPILARGVLRNFLYDCWDAHQHKAESTHSANRGGFKSLPTTGTHHLVLSSSRARPVAKLLQDVDAGYYVDSVLGAHTANHTTGDFSVTAPNVWRIEGGTVAGPCTQVALAGNLPTLLGKVRSVSREVKRMEGAHMPHVLLDDVAVSH